jgi:hypothetical protein
MVTNKARITDVRSVGGFPSTAEGGEKLTRKYVYCAAFVISHPENERRAGRDARTRETEGALPPMIEPVVLGGGGDTVVDDGVGGND